MHYDIDMETISKKIDATNPEKVCIQLPDGLKPEAESIITQLRTEYPRCQFFIWGGSNFGACDTPARLETIDIDLLISFGHTEWK
ncbi:MAG: diphthamide synthesis protein [Nanoarchaeota archaeon]